MIEQRPTPVATVSPGVPKLLQDDYFIRFSDAWPGTLPAVMGKFFQIEKTNQVNYDLNYIIPSGDFRDVDLSNAAGGENIYPEETKTLYEVALGFKPGNYLVHFFIPAGLELSRLEQASMTPNVASATLRYLGAIKPEDSPYDDKRIFLYFVKDVEPVILRTFVDGALVPIVHEKCVFGLTVNKCYLRQITAPTQDQRRVAKTIQYFTELRW